MGEGVQSVIAQVLVKISPVVPDPRAVAVGAVDWGRYDPFYLDLVLF
jgi:hypothetical protein